MNKDLTLSINQSVTRLFNSNKSGHLIGTFAVSVSFAVVGLIGDTLGTDTSFASALVINLAYLLAIVVATVVLKAQGCGWRDLGLAFLINNLAGALGNLKARWVLALVGSSLLFGLVHYDWGLAGIIETFIAGLIFGAVYLRTGRNL